MGLLLTFSIVVKSVRKEKKSHMPILKEITHFTILDMPEEEVKEEEPIYSLPPWWPSSDDFVVDVAELEVEQRPSIIYPAGFIASAPSDASTTDDGGSLSNVSIKDENDSNNSNIESSHSFAFSPSITLPSTIQFPSVAPTPFPSSLYVNCPSLTSTKRKRFNEFFKENKPVKIMLLSCFIFTVILILALIIYFILLVISVRRHEY
uniref:Uncharacterized protein n=1 Tax=Panagrolaimus sp. PS1159 TaxID=55785 RepID=A0AC35FFN6_9BILA